MVKSKAPDPKNMPRIPKVPTKVKMLVCSPLDSFTPSPILSVSLKNGDMETKLQVVTSHSWLTMCIFSANLITLSLFFSQATSNPSAMSPPTSAKTDSIRGMPMIPNIRQNSRPPNVSAAKFPYPSQKKISMYRLNRVSGKTVHTTVCRQCTVCL